MRRKITRVLEEWLRKDMDVCPIIYGARQVGKTYSIEEFGKSHFKNYLRLDFSTNLSDREIFKGDLDVDSIMMGITSAYPDVRLTPGETMLFFDEIQDCPEARTVPKPGLLSNPSLKMRPGDTEWWLPDPYLAFI